MSKPYHALLLLIVLAALYYAIASVLPQQAIRLGFADVRFPLPELATAPERISGDTLNNADQQLLSKVKNIAGAHPDSLNKGPDEIRDSTKAAESETSSSLKRVGISTVSIESDNPESALTKFVKSAMLPNTRDEVVRVLHFGDSQIEGDRVTSELRSGLQGKYGGKGIGLIPITSNAIMPVGLSASFSDDWRSVSVMNADPMEKSECLLGAFASLQPSSSFRNVVELIVRSYRVFNRLLIPYGKTDSSFTVDFYADGKLIQQTHCPSATGIGLISVELPHNFSKINIEVKNPARVSIYGLFAESNHGVSVCNIPVRGSSGNFFSSLDRGLASQLFELLNVRLIILQFGINVVPSNLSNYRYFEDLMSRQISTIKSIAPQADILVVGVSDMASRIDGVLQSYPSVELVLNAQRNAALRNGVAFWNGLSAMGGRGAVIDWVNASPSLATKDYTHFTYRGAQLFGKALTESMLDYINRYPQAQAESLTTSDKGAARW